MILKSALQEVIDTQKKALTTRKLGVIREKLPALENNSGMISVITGIRRCGKSTLLKQHMSQNSQPFGFLNFEDPRLLSIEVGDFFKLRELFGAKTQCLYFDEIQNVDQWEVAIRSLHDEGYRLLLTGSNASMLSRELGTKLTGRHLPYELFPFSYAEFFAYTNQERGVPSFTDYLDRGGFPEFLRSGNREVLHQLLRDIVNRDILVRYGLRNSTTVMNVLLHLISNAAKPYTYNKLKNTYGVGSANSISDYVQWFEDSYLIFSVPQFSWSAKSSSVNPKKVYAIDTGFAKANSLSFSNDDGRLLENAVFLALRRSTPEIFYFKQQGECDFVVRDKNQIVRAIQVCYSVDANNQAREVGGLREAMDFFNLDRGELVTLDQEDTLVNEGKQIDLVPAWKWVQ